jgi:hypothetical protein
MSLWASDTVISFLFGVEFLLSHPGPWLPAAGFLIALSRDYV